MMPQLLTAEQISSNWFIQNWQSNLFTLLTVLLSGIISLVISAAYYRKGNRNNLRLQVIHPAIRVLKSKDDRAKYAELHRLSNDYTTRYFTKNERQKFMALLEPYRIWSEYDINEESAKAVTDYFLQQLEHYGISIKGWDWDTKEYGEWGKEVGDFDHKLTDYKPVVKKQKEIAKDDKPFDEEEFAIEFLNDLLNDLKFPKELTKVLKKTIEEEKANLVFNGIRYRRFVIAGVCRDTFHEYFPSVDIDHVVVFYFRDPMSIIDCRKIIEDNNKIRSDAEKAKVNFMALKIVKQAEVLFLDAS